ncbi:MAG: DsrE family protein [Glutamicibacter sp.]
MNPHLLLHLAGTGDAPQPNLEMAARNARAELPDWTIELVVQGPQVALLATGSELAQEVVSLVDAGFIVSACANSLRSAAVDGEGLAVGVRVVSAAVARLATAQIDGAAYIRV